MLPTINILILPDTSPSRQLKPGLNALFGIDKRTDPRAIYELNVYLAVLVLLLGVRFPAVKQRLIGRQQRSYEPPVIPLPELWPQENGRERVIPLADVVYEADSRTGSQKMLPAETGSSHKVPQKDF